eukprot:Tamp_22180.p1 GENE.Tamp_22180~~Tamp_22180.p1  ORF type:complete len:200 (+),score=15.94 Tamp_22180:494-1093(+)
MPSPSPARGIQAAALPKLLSAYDEHPGVAVHWVIFGSSHHISPPPGLVVENFVWRAAEAHPVIKTIVQPSKVAVVGGHNHQYIAGQTAVNDVFEPIPFNQSSGESASSHSPPSTAVLRLHHYRTKSRAHALWRFERDSTFRLNEFDNEDIYPSSVASQAQWLDKWDANEIKDEWATGYAACIRQGFAMRPPPSSITDAA